MRFATYVVSAVSAFAIVSSAMPASGSSKDSKSPSKAKGQAKASSTMSVEPSATPPAADPLAGILAPLDGLLRRESEENDGGDLAMAVEGLTEASGGLSRRDVDTSSAKSALRNVEVNPEYAGLNRRQAGVPAGVPPAGLLPDTKSATAATAPATGNAQILGRQVDGFGTEVSKYCIGWGTGNTYCSRKCEQNGQESGECKVNDKTKKIECMCAKAKPGTEGENEDEKEDTKEDTKEDKKKGKKEDDKEEKKDEKEDDEE